MRRALVRGTLAAALSCGTVAALAGSAGATTVPDDTKVGDERAPGDPELDAAVAVFEGRMVDAGYTNLGPAPDAEASDETEDFEQLDKCAPEVRESIEALEEFGELTALGDATMAASDRFGPATDEPTSTTTDPFAALFGGSEEVIATAHRLDGSQIEVVDQLVEVLGSPAFADCWERIVSASMEGIDTAMPEMPDLSLPDFSDFTIPEMPDFSDFTIPEMPDFTMPDFSDLTIPEISIPDLSWPGGQPAVEFTATPDLGIGDTSGGFRFTMTAMPFDVAVDTVIVRSGDVLVTVSHTRMNVTGEPMAVDLAAEAEAIVAGL